MMKNMGLCRRLLAAILCLGGFAPAASAQGTTAEHAKRAPAREGKNSPAARRPRPALPVAIPVDTAYRAADAAYKAYDRRDFAAAELGNTAKAVRGRTDFDSRGRPGHIWRAGPA